KPKAVFADERGVTTHIVGGFALVVGEGRTAERAGTLAELPVRAVVSGADAHVGPALLSIVAAPTSSAGSTTYTG
ncbi:hypothetical protein ACWDNR_22880, partial [Gordonia aichiensis]